MATLTSNLLRAISEAVDFYDDGKEVYVSVDLAADRVLGVNPDRKKLPPGQIEGPFRSSLAPSRAARKSSALIGGDVCYHMNWSEWSCLEPGFAKTLRSLELPHPRDKKKTLRVGTDVDAIIFGRPAWRKFVVPYLLSVYGIDEAYKRRNP